MTHDITYMWNVKYGTNEPSARQKQIHGHGEHTCGFLGGKGGVGWTGNLGLIDANYCL